MSLTDALQSTFAVCGLPTLALGLFTTLMLWIARPEQRSPRHIAIYVAVPLVIYFFLFTLGIWLSGTFIGNNWATFYQ
jgi:hypothetical protein